MAGLARIYPGPGEATMRAARGAALGLALLFMFPLGTTAGEGVGAAALSASGTNATWIVISKRERALYLYNGSHLIRRSQVAVGKQAGDKLRAGGMRTPEGRFYIQSIHDSRSWVHDFGAGWQSSICRKNSSRKLMRCDE